MVFWRTVGMALLAIPLFLRGLAQMVPDSTYAVQGWATLDLSLYDEVIEMASTHDGGALLLIMATEVDSLGADSDVLLAKLNAAGQFDPSFGSGGFVRFDFGGIPQSQPVSLAVADDGQIAVVGTATAPAFPDESRFQVMVLDAAGYPSPTFGDGGWVSLGFISHVNVAKDVAWDAAGNLLVAGHSLDTAFIHRELPVVARLLPTGQLDSSFGGTGKLIYSYLNGLEPLKVHLNGGYWNDVAVEPSGRILCAGAFANGTNDQCWMMALTPDGKLDSTFSTDGLTGFNMAGDFTNAILRLLPLPDGRFGMAVHEESPWFSNHFYMALHDVSTETTQLLETDWIEGESKCWDAAADATGHLYFLGHGSDPSHAGTAWPGDWAALAGLSPDGTALAAVGTEGRWSMDMAPAIGGGRAVLALPDGRVLLAGTRYGASSESADAWALMLKPTTSVGVVESSSVDGDAYPNPFGDRLVLHADGSAPFTLLDMQGRVLMQGIVEEEVELNTSQLPRGIYLLQLGNASKRLVRQ